MITKSNWPAKEGIRIGYLNINSVANKIDEVSNILANSGKPYHLFCFAESRLSSKNSDSDLAMPGYNIVRLDPTVFNETGLLVYISQSISFKRTTAFENYHIESTWLEVNLKRHKPIMVGFLYRNPAERMDWHARFNDLMEAVNLKANEIIVLGDFNLDLMKPNYRWTQLYENLGLILLNNKPTRITNTSETLIDHIYVNAMQNIIEICTTPCGCSDHYSISITWCKKGIKIPKIGHKIINYRSYAKFDEDAYLNDLNIAPLQNVFGFTDPDEAMEYWQKTFLEVFNRHAPMKTQRVKHSIKPPWLTKEIENEMRIRDKLIKTKKFTEFKKQRNKVTKLIRQSKKSYFQNMLNKNPKTDSKTIWSAINRLTKSNSNNSGIPKSLSPDALNNHFVDIAKFTVKCDRSCNNELKLLKDYCLARNIRTDLKIPFLTVSEVYFYLIHLKQTKSRGLDNIDGKILKLSAPIIADSLTYIYNLSIAKEYYPTVLKQAKVIPLYKSGNKADPTNYRPISIVSVLSKPLEQHINKHLLTHVTHNKLLHSSQSGFRKNHSCHTALILLVDKWLENINESKFSGVIFADFAKAFDVIDHKLLLTKLAVYKVSQSAIQYIRSFLSNRKQAVCCNNLMSDYLLQDSGVPQGSVLGPLLFSLYINDLPLYINNATCELFADDTSIHSSHSQLTQLSINLQENVNQIVDWSELNHMSLNPNKTKYMVVASRQKRQAQHTHMPPIYIASSKIDEVDSHKLLGITIDKNMTWGPHIDQLCKQISQKVFQLSKIKHFLDLEARKQFFHAHIQSMIDYASTLYDTASENIMKPLIGAHKKALKIVLLKSSSPISEDYRKLNILPLNTKLKYNKAVTMYRIMNNLAPERLKENFPINQSRYTNAINILKPQTDIFKSSLKFSGAELWNSLLKVSNINNNSLLSFKRSYKILLMQNTT